MSLMKSFSLRSGLVSFDVIDIMGTMTHDCKSLTTSLSKEP